MSILLYCITDAATPLPAPHHGVGAKEVESFEHSNLRCFISGLDAPISSGGTSGRDSALAFHRVLQDIFTQGAIIPFRFPTLMEGKTALSSYLDQHAAEYLETLCRLRDMVQMEIRISGKDDPIAAGSGKPTGGDYLRAKHAREKNLRVLTEIIQEAAKPCITGWRERVSSEGTRIFALVRRSAVDEFRQAMAALKLPSEIQVRISGPWPATAFLEKHNVGG